jgi:hypothetical protein
MVLSVLEFHETALKAPKPEKQKQKNAGLCIIAIEK